MFEGAAYIYEVYKTRSFSKAAQALYISQPALSAYVRKIEKKIGMPLFDRSTSPIKLTECGEMYIEAARKIMRIQEDFKEDVDALKNMIGGSLSIGASNFYATSLLPPIISKFSKEHPSVAIRLTEGSVEDLENRLFTGELDFVIEANLFDDTIFDRIRISHEHLVLVASEELAITEALTDYQLSTDDIKLRRHVSGDVSEVDLSLFKDETFILLREENDIRARVDNIFKEAHFSPSHILTMDHQMTAFYLAAQGLGVAFISDTLINNIPPVKGVSYYKLDNASIHRDVYFYHKKTKYMTPAMEEFSKIAMESFTL